MPTPCAKASAGPCELDRPVVEDHGSFVRRVDALQDAHQRRLSGAVSADHGVDRLRRHGEVDAIVGHDQVEPACNAARAQTNRDAGRFSHLKKAG